MFSSQASRKKIWYGKLIGPESGQILAAGNVLIERNEPEDGPVSFKAWFIPWCTFQVSTDRPCRLRLSKAIQWEVRLEPTPVDFNSLFLTEAAGPEVPLPPYYRIGLTDLRWQEPDWFDSSGG